MILVRRVVSREHQAAFVGYYGLGEREQEARYLNAKSIPGPYRVFFTSFDCNEPPHVHVERESSTCKLWLEPVELARSHGFTARELNVIRRIINAHLSGILEAWNEHCG